jgi:pullulanase-type alpha-1,6-glucosidase
VTDPYSAGLTVDSARSVLVDLADPAWMPELWAGSANPAPLRTQAAQTIYELHVRDFSAADQTVPAAWRGTYLAFTAFGSAGMAHLAELAEAGITTVHLLPTFDFTSVPEERADQAAGVIPDAPPDSAEQQAAVAAVADRDAFNWGYDPWHWGVPEGSYATAGNQSGGARTAEFRSMVGALHSLGLRVVLDQVFNHTAASGQWPNSVLDRIVPGYYHRLDASGTVQNSTCCDNVAVERAMAGKLVVDTVVSWAKNYHVDGFRFDIMGHHPLSNILAVRAALDALTLEADGVDGQAIYLYGEAWNFGEVADDALFTQATQAHLTGTGIGAFNDRLRDAVRGGGPFDTDQRTYQGFATGLYTDPNGMFAEVGEEQREELLLETNLVRLSLAGCLADFAFPAPGGGTVLGRDIDYGGQAAGFAAEPDECVNYVDAHDNETLFDNGIFKLPTATSMADRVRMNTLALATTALGQAPSFWHAGTEILRSKSGDRNSYNAGDHFNAIDWSLETNVFGTGLPMERDNAARWDILAPLLADPALKPGQADMEQAYAMALDLLRLRSSTPLFTLGSADLIRERVSFPAAGPDSRPGLLAMAVDDRAGLASGDVDPALDGLLVVFNASAGTITEPLEGLAGRAYTLHPVQRDGADPVVRETAWDAGSGTITIPARTVAVLVLEAGAEPVAVDPASRSAVPALAAAALTLAAAGLIAAFAARRRRA